MLTQVCSEKLQADAADVHAGAPPSRFSTFVQQWALRRFGIQAVANQQLVELCETLRR